MVHLIFLTDSYVEEQNSLYGEYKGEEPRILVR